MLFGLGLVRNAQNTNKKQKEKFTKTDLKQLLKDGRHNKCISNNHCRLKDLLHFCIYLFKPSPHTQR